MYCYLFDEFVHYLLRQFGYFGVLFYRSDKLLGVIGFLFLCLNELTKLANQLFQFFLLVFVGFGESAKTLGIGDIGNSIASVLTGATIDSNNVVISASEDGGNPVAIGFRAKKSNGKYRYFWLYRVKFGIPSTSLATKGDSITFSTPTIEGTVLRRNKPDGSGKHPWKAEVTEGEKDVPASVVTDWYKSVYEPAYSATPPEVLPTENEEV